MRAKRDFLRDYLVKPVHFLDKWPEAQRREETQSLSWLHSGCFQDPKELHQQLCWLMYPPAVKISTIPSWNQFREHEKNISLPPIPFKHSLFQFPFPSSKISPADPSVACPFWYLKMPRPFQFKLQSHIQLIMLGIQRKALAWSVLRTGGSFGHFFHPVLFCVLSSCSVSETREKVQGWWYLGQTSLPEEVPLQSFLLTLPASSQKPRLCMKTNAPSDMRLIDIFFQKPLGMDLPTTQFSCRKHVFQFELTTNTAFDGVPCSLLQPGAPGQIGSHHAWDDGSSPSTSLCVCWLMGNPNILASPRASVPSSLSCSLSLHWLLCS